MKVKISMDRLEKYFEDRNKNRVEIPNLYKKMVEQQIDNGNFIEVIKTQIKKAGREDQVEIGDFYNPEEIARNSYKDCSLCPFEKIIEPEFDRDIRKKMNLMDDSLEEMHFYNRCHMVAAALNKKVKDTKNVSFEKNVEFLCFGRHLAMNIYEKQYKHSNFY